MVLFILYYNYSLLITIESIFQHGRAVLFRHMFDEHNFNIGLADNLVNVNEFLEILEKKLAR